MMSWMGAGLPGSGPVPDFVGAEQSLRKEDANIGLSVFC